MNFIGIDLHSNQFTCFMILRDGSTENRTFPINDLGFASFFRFVPPDSYALIEASTNTFAFADKIDPYFSAVYVANPFQLKLISMLNHKTDKVDAKKLALYLKMQMVSGEHLIKPVYIPDERIRTLRSLFSTHLLLKKQRTQTKNRIHSLFKQHLYPFTKEYIFGKKRFNDLLSINLPESLSFQIKLLAETLSHLEVQIQQIEHAIIQHSSPFKKEVDILTSMKGISILTAIALIADIADISRFDNAKKLSSYLRAAPGVDSSNLVTRNLSTNKKGRKLSVTLISQSLNHFRDSNPHLSGWYHNLERYKPKGKIRMGLARKVICEIFHMLKYQEYHYCRDESNHLKKMEQFDAIIRRTA